MAIAEELNRLDELRTRGALTEDEFQRAKARLLDGGAAPSDAPAVAALNRFRRSVGDRWIGGVCGGLGTLTGVESWIWRLVLVALALFGGARPGRGGCATGRGAGRTGRSRRGRRASRRRPDRRLSLGGGARPAT